MMVEFFTLVHKYKKTVLLNSAAILAQIALLSDLMADVNILVVFEKACAACTYSSHSYIVFLCFGA